MEDNARSALSLWNDWIVDRPDTVASKMAMSGEQMILKAAVIDGNNVCEGLSLFPVLGQWDSRNPGYFGTNLAWVGKNIFEEISHKRLDTVLPLCTGTLVQGIVLLFNNFRESDNYRWTQARFEQCVSSFDGGQSWE